MLISRYSVAAAAVFLLFAACGAEDTGGAGDPAPADTVSASPFEAVNTAAETVNRCSYSFVFSGTGSLARQPALTGTLIGNAEEDEGETLLRIEMGHDSLPDQPGEVEMSLLLVGGEDTVYVYSYENNILEKGALELGGSDLLRPAGYSIMQEFFIADPFADEIGSSVEETGSRTVAGVDCIDYMVTYSSDQKALWSIGAEDYLPRRVERFTADREGEPVSLILEISDLDTQPDIQPETFTMDAPEDASVEIYSAFLQPGTEAPLWTLLDRDGEAVSLEGLAGRVVVLDFWATWCGPCQAVMPAIDSLSRFYSEDQVVFYGVNVWENSDPAAFMDENGYGYGLLLEGDPVAEDYKVSGIPTMYVVDRDGIVAMAEVGANPEIADLLSTTIDSLLAQ